MSTSNANCGTGLAPLPHLSSTKRAIITARFTARVTCGVCQNDILAEIDEEIVGTIETLTEEIPLAIDEEKERQGWKGEYCPECAERFRDQLHAERNAEIERGAA